MEMSRKGFGANAYVALDHGGNQKAHWPAAQRFDLMNLTIRSYLLPLCYQKNLKNLKNH
jgi:hypothetical protein